MHAHIGQKHATSQNIPHPRKKNGINASIQEIYLPNNLESGDAWGMGTVAQARRRLGRQGWGPGEAEEHCQASLQFAYASSLPTATPRRHALVRCQAKPTGRMGISGSHGTCAAPRSLAQMRRPMVETGAKSRSGIPESSQPNDTLLRDNGHIPSRTISQPLIRAA